MYRKQINMEEIKIYRQNIGSSKVNASIGLLTNVPMEIKNKILRRMYSNSNDGNVEENIEVIILYKYNAQNIKGFIEQLGGTFYDLQFNFAIVTIPISKIWDLANYPEINYMELPKELFESDTSITVGACGTQKISVKNEITGKGVIAGFIDSGIDFTHPAFKDKEGNTRILYIYDLVSNVVYDKNQINAAIKSNNPYEMIPVEDITGHGTHVAGEACGGGNVPSEYKGIAEDSSIIMVRGGRGRWVLSSNIMKGLKFLIDKSKEQNMPLVVNISLSTNYGSHNEASLLEQYISTVAELEKVTIVVAAGNEGDAGHHVEGTISRINKQRQAFNIANDESMVAINVYKSILPQATISIIGPKGINSGEIEIQEGYKTLTIGQTRCDIYISGARPFDLESEIQIILTPKVSEFIIEGTWSIEINSVDQETGNYYIWLPISEGLNPKTRFLTPSQNNTLGIPATVRNVISVGAYNSTTNTLSTFSGRGGLNQNYVKPDILAPGENIYGPLVGGGYDTKTGTSMAAPQVAGVCLLFSEWGIVKQNDPLLYGQRLKYYLIVGANRNRTNIVYPSVSWGYGSICPTKSFSILYNDILQNRGEFRNSHLKYSDENYIKIEEINDYMKIHGDLNHGKSKLFYRMPE